MRRQVLDEGAHLAGHGVALLLGLQAGAVLQAQEHLAHFILARVGQDNDIEVIIIEAMAEILWQPLLAHHRHDDTVDVVGMLGQIELAGIKLEDSAQVLLLINDFVLLRRLALLAPGCRSRGGWYRSTAVSGPDSRRRAVESLGSCRCGSCSCRRRGVIEASYRFP